MDYTVIFCVLSLVVVCSTSSSEECNCPFGLEEFLQVQSELSLLRADVDDIKGHMRSESEDTSDEDNEIPDLTNNDLVGDIVLMDNGNAHTQPPRPPKIGGFVYATCKPMPNSALQKEQFQPITGSINLKQNASGGPLYIDIFLYGFRSQAFSLHGFHIHKFGDLQEGCGSTGGHFNPYDRNHGGPDSVDRHAGDLGNIQPNRQGVVNTQIIDNLASLVGINSILGRAFVIHEGEDDLGLGGFSDSLTTGHAGARLACCVIGRSDQ